jgi:iron(III) transport system permease protein
MTATVAKPVGASGLTFFLRRTDVRRWSGRVGLLAFVVGVGYLVLMPLYRLQSEALSNGAAGYSSAYQSSNFWRMIRYTVFLAFGSLAIALVLGTLLAWAASRLPRKLSLLRILPIFPIVVPAIANVVGWAFLFSPRPGYLNAQLRKLPWWNHLTEGPVDIYTMPWIVILTGFGLTSFVYLFVSAGFANISGEHIEAAQVAGSGPWKVFFKVILPLLRPTLVYGGGVALLLGLGQFTGPLLLGRNTGIDVVTTFMYRSMSDYPARYGEAAALGSPLLLFGIIVVIMQKVIMGDQRRFVTHSGKSFRPQGRTSKLGALGIVMYSTVATILPLGSLFLVSFSKFWTARIEPGKWNLDNYRRIFETDTITDGIKNSVFFALAAVAISLPLGFIAANVLLHGRRHRILRTALDFIVSMPLGIPAVVFGVGFLLTYTKGPFVLYGTNWVMILVYCTLMLPFTTRMQLSALVSLGSGYVEAARVSGTGVVRSQFKVVLPLMRSSMGGAAALMFVLLTHEFAASILVRSSRTQVMGTVLYDAWGNGSYPLVAAIAVIMTLVTALGVAAAVVVGGSEALTKL